MSNKFSFDLESQDPRRDLPRKIVIGQNEMETSRNVVFKFGLWFDTPFTVLRF
ncbi:MAG: hypothetical protein ABI651_00165 [Verrucomicrobiota bacterium]